MENSHHPVIDAAEVARQLAAELDQRGREYALGGAIALGFWAAPRGTVDVDLTLFLPPEKPSECLWLLQDLGCEFAASDALRALQENGFCQVRFQQRRVDIFLPTLPFYETARRLDLRR